MDNPFTQGLATLEANGFYQGDKGSENDASVCLWLALPGSKAAKEGVPRSVLRGYLVDAVREVDPSAEIDDNDISCLFEWNDRQETVEPVRDALRAAERMWEATHS